MFRRFFWWLVLVMLLGVLSWLGVQSYREFRRGEVIRQEIERLQQEEQRINRENAVVRDNIESLKTDDSLKLEAKKINYKEEGERLVIFQPGGVSTEKKVSFSENDGVVAGVVFRKPNYRLWWEVFFDF